MKTEVMDVLLYIFERFQEDEFIPMDKAQTLIDELEDLGFHSSKINSALDWLDGLIENSSSDFAPLETEQQNIRVYHPYELKYLSIECCDFLYFLEQQKVLDPHSREAVVDRVMALDSQKTINLDDLKWVIMMVLFNLPGKQEAAVWLENIDNHFH